ncbi:hypothetical protein D3C77_585140 [compost metagenome]
MLLGHRLEPTEYRTGAGGHDHPEQRPQALFETDQLGVFAFWCAYPDQRLLDRRQAMEVFDDPVQVDRRRAMAEFVLTQRAIAATLMLQACPLRCPRGSFLVVGAIQFDPVTEIVLIIQGDAVFNSHQCSIVMTANRSELNQQASVRY